MMRSLLWYGKNIRLLILLIMLSLFTQDGYSHLAISQNESGDIELFDGYPVWSPSGQNIAFVSGRSSNFNIWLIDIGTRDLTNLTNTTNVDYNDVSWSPDGYTLVFSSNITGNWDVWMLDLRKQKLRNLTEQNLLPDENPRWSPNGQFLVYISFRSIGENFREDPDEFVTDIVIIDTGSSNITTLTSSSKHFYFSPEWSTNNRELAFVEIKPDEKNLWVINVQNHESKQLTQGVVVNDFSWIPNTQKIVYSKLQIYDYSLWEVDSVTLEIEHKTPLVIGNGEDPQISPDGKTIAFVAWSDAKRDIWTMHMDGKNLVNLTEDLNGDSFYPRWSPDSSKLAFMFENNENPTYSDNDTDIWIVDINSSDLVQLTDSQK